MGNLEFSPFYEQKLLSVVGTQLSSATQQLVLVVDDDEDNLLLLAYALEPLGCIVVTATDGMRGLLLAQTYQPDLILLDVLMPYMDGIEVVTQLRKDSSTKSIPVIAVTALALKEDQERLLKAGFNDYIIKPYFIEDIEATVQRHLCQKVAIS
ncbi:MAG: response regulator [Symplocastrum torsivum CPER-KK1]|jgi:CheY-like chemotaxis protein|uniref:Response regulator n=1 Tax=Symplocastrum torsivum CPER-KK1 TaxID=450513 RepID=A0A951U9D4_9CYAN|nr:response regulator [Symplocastrum torsivum CPER-KK1]